MKQIHKRWIEMGAAAQWRVRILLALLIGAVVPSSIALSLTRDWPSLLLNIGSEMGGALITFILLDMILTSRDEKESKERKTEELRQRLIHKLGSSVNSESRRAAEELRALGWLTDGSLNGVELINANLEGVDLRGACLRGAHLHRANMRSARLSEADLSGALMVAADMSGASCVRLKLEGAYLNGVNMSGCTMLGKNTLVLAARLKGAIMPDGCRYDGSFCLDDDLRHLEKHCTRRKLDTSDVDVVAEWYGIELDMYTQGQEWAVRHLAAVRAGSPEFVGEYVSVR